MITRIRKIPYRQPAVGGAMLTLSCLVASKWKRAMTAPSNSVPRPVLTVAGEKAFHTIVSQIFVAINKEIPDPKP